MGRFRLQNLHFANAELLPDFMIDAFVNIVQVCVYGNQRNVLTNGFQDIPANVVVAQQRFPAAKPKRVMRNKNVCSESFGLFQSLLRNFQGNQNFFRFFVGFAN